MNESQLTFSFGARFFTSAPVTDTTEQVWFVLHGYGQLARYFLRKFDSILSDKITIVAPEGLSRFYLEPVTGTGRKNNRVGATWMTRENREMDIRNYIRYLNAVYREVVGDRHLPVTILGFSQGAATASRWALDHSIRFDRLILWAGVFPPDMNFDTGNAVLKEKQVMFVYGNQDIFITPERLEEMNALVSRLQLQVRSVTFDGGHDITPEALQRIVKG